MNVVISDNKLQNQLMKALQAKDSIGNPYKQVKLRILHVFQKVINVRMVSRVGWKTNGNREESRWKWNLADLTGEFKK